MDPELKRNLTSTNIWLRALYMVVFAVLYSIAEIVIAAVVLLQFLITLVTGNSNSNLLKFGAQLSAYAYRIFLFLTFNTEDKPFPFVAWDASGQPPGTGGGGSNSDNREIPALVLPDNDQKKEP